MTPTQALKYTELTLRAQREDLHAANSLAKLASTGDGERYRHNGRCNRMTSRHWRAARAHCRIASEARRQAASILGGAS